MTFADELNNENGEKNKTRNKRLDKNISFNRDPEKDGSLERAAKTLDLSVYEVKSLMMHYGYSDKK